MKADGPIVVFDTNCVLCSGMVAFILAHEQAPVLRFAGAWSDEGVKLAAAYGFKPPDLDETFLVIRDGKALTRSDAGMEIVRHLRAPWRWAAMIAAVPRPLRNAVYDFVARRRYRWFGKRQDCTIVPVTERHRFIGVFGSSNMVACKAAGSGESRCSSVASTSEASSSPNAWPMQTRGPAPKGK